MSTVQYTSPRSLWVRTCLRIEAQCTTNESVKRKRASESEKVTDKVRRARRRAWLGILYIHDTCFPKNNNTALICHNLHNQCSRQGNVRWEGDHIRVVLKPKNSRGITKEVVSRISACLCNIGCKCVLDQVSIAQQQQVQLEVQH